MQVLLLSILRMNRMLKKLSITSIIGHLDMTGAGYLWNGLRVNVVAIMMGLNHWQTRARLKVCLLSSFIPSTPKFVILKGTLILMGRCLMSEFVGTLHLCSLTHRKKLLKLFRLHICARY